MVCEVQSGLAARWRHPLYVLTLDLHGEAPPTTRRLPDSTLKFRSLSTEFPLFYTETAFSPLTFFARTVHQAAGYRRAAPEDQRDTRLIGGWGLNLSQQETMATATRSFGFYSAYIFSTVHGDSSWSIATCFALEVRALRQGIKDRRIRAVTPTPRRCDGPPLYRRKLPVMATIGEERHALLPR